jgi:hypothetical protein
MLSDSCGYGLPCEFSMPVQEMMLDFMLGLG